MKFTKVLVIGSLGSLLHVAELEGVPEDRVMEYAVAFCKKNGLTYKSAFACDAVSYCYNTLTKAAA